MLLVSKILVSFMLHASKVMWHVLSVLWAFLPQSKDVVMLIGISKLSEECDWVCERCDIVCCDGFVPHPGVSPAFTQVPQ